MRLGTSTNLLFARPDGSRMPLERAMELMSEAGFRVFDLNFYDWSLPGSPFLTDDWETWVHGVAAAAARQGLVFGQCHGYFFNFADPGLSKADYEYHKRLQRRSFECCRILGASVCVLHPETVYAAADYEHQSLAVNQRFFEQVLEETVDAGFQIAVENMCDFGIAPRRKYAAYPEQLRELVASFQTGRIGICWDFEHADIMEQNQRECLYYLRDYLIATHVSDTHSRTDSTLMHVLPLTGGIDWREIMRTLKDIRYQGDFCYEVHNYMNRLPDEVLVTGLKLAYEIGEYLMKLADQSAVHELSRL